MKMKNKFNHVIDKSIIERKKEPGNRRVSQVASTLKKIVLDVMNREFVETCSDFSVISTSMSPDLRYLDIYVFFYNIDSKEEKEEFLKMLNYDDLSPKQRLQSKFFKISLKYFLTENIIKKARLRIVPNIRFKLATNDMMFFMENPELRVNDFC